MQSDYHTEVQGQNLARKARNVLVGALALGTLGIAALAERDRLSDYISGSTSPLEQQINLSDPATGVPSPASPQYPSPYGAKDGDMIHYYAPRP